MPDPTGNVQAILEEIEAVQEALHLRMALLEDDPHPLARAAVDILERAEAELETLKENVTPLRVVG